MGRFAVVVLALSACGRVGFATTDVGDARIDASVDGSPVFTNGARLHAWTYRSGDAIVFGGWTDTVYATDCELKQISGTTYCYPSQIEQGALDPLTVSTYSDAGCATPTATIAHGVRDGACISPPGLYIHDAGIYHVGPSITTPAFELAGSTCQASAPSDDQYALIDPIQLTDLVAGTLVEEGAGRLHVQRWIGADGSSQIVQLIDADLGAPCTLAATLDGRVTCDSVDLRMVATTLIPGTRHEVYADAACSQRGAFAQGGTTPTVIVDDASVSCPTELPHDFAVGAEITTPYSFDDGSCQPLTGGAVYVLLGAPQPLLPRFTGTYTIEGTGSVRPLVVDIGGMRLRDELFWDADHARPCEVRPDEAGAARCYPLSRPIQQFVHHSPVCSDGTTLAWAACDGDRATTGRMVTYNSNRCSVVTFDVYDATLTSTGLYRLRPTGCEPITDPWFLRETTLAPSAGFPSTPYTP